MRILIAEDHVLLREGMCRLLAECGHEVVAQVGDAGSLAGAVAAHRPDLAVVDVRMPPTMTDDGLRAALAIRRTGPAPAVLVVSQYVEPAHARDLLALPGGGVGYLLKDRVASAAEFADSVDRVGAGDVLVDASLVRRFLSPGADAPLAALSRRELEVLERMARGQSNAAIAAGMVVTGSAVEKNIGRIFSKLGLSEADDVNRRTMAVLTYLRATGRYEPM